MDSVLQMGKTTHTNGYTQGDTHTHTHTHTHTDSVKPHTQMDTHKETHTHGFSNLPRIIQR